MEVNQHIKILDPQRKYHAKASEEYINVEMSYPNDGEVRSVWIPVEYRRTGVSIKENDFPQLVSYLNKVYNELDPENYNKWLADQKKFWDTKPNAKTTKSFFDALSDGNWHCRECQLPKNPNFARRIQDLKEFGYTLATDTNRYCPHCEASKTHIMLLPINRVTVEGNGYETWSPKLRKRIIRALYSIDIYENALSPHCLPDHKFSEIRWDETTKSTNPEDMTDGEIRNKFQLLTNQRNQQKREICRTCFQTGKRGTMFGISFYYEGTDIWDPSIPKKGKAAEKGCIGCPWYDIKVWRKHLIDKLKG